MPNWLATLAIDYLRARKWRVSPPEHDADMRLPTITQKVPKALTGLKGSIFVHVDQIAGQIQAIRLSEKKKDGHALDKAFTAIGDVLTSIAQDLNETWKH